MATLLRLILALSIAIQSLPGLALRPCSSMAGSASAVAPGTDDEPACPCCQSQGPSDCEKPVVCSCKSPAREQPQAPQPDREHKSLDLVLAVLPTFVTLVPTRQSSNAARLRGLAALPHSSAPSVQSLLCVWLM